MRAPTVRRYSDNRHRVVMRVDWQLTYDEFSEILASVVWNNPMLADRVLVDGPERTWFPGIDWIVTEIRKHLWAHGDERDPFDPDESEDAAFVLEWARLTVALKIPDLARGAT